MTWKYKNVFRVICALVNEIEPPAVEGRVRHFKRLGVPVGCNTGTGKPANYTDAMVWELAVVSTLNQMGITPVVAIEMTRGWDFSADPETFPYIVTPAGTIALNFHRIRIAIEQERQRIPPAKRPRDVINLKAKKAA